MEEAFSVERGVEQLPSVAHTSRISEGLLAPEAAACFSVKKNGDSSLKFGIVGLHASFAFSKLRFLLSSTGHGRADVLSSRPRAIQFCRSGLGVSGGEVT